MATIVVTVSIQTTYQLEVEDRILEEYEAARASEHRDLSQLELLEGFDNFLTKKAFDDAESVGGMLTNLEWVRMTEI